MPYSIGLYWIALYWSLPHQLTVKTLLMQVTKRASDQFLICVVVKVAPAINLRTIIMKYR